MDTCTEFLHLDCSNCKSTLEIITKRTSNIFHDAFSSPWLFNLQFSTKALDSEEQNLPQIIARVRIVKVPGRQKKTTIK